MHRQNSYDPYDLPDSLRVGLSPGSSPPPSTSSRQATSPPLERPQYVVFNSRPDARQSSSSIPSLGASSMIPTSSSPRPTSAQQAPLTAPLPARWSPSIQSSPPLTEDRNHPRQFGQENSSFNRWSPFDTPQPVPSTLNSNNQHPWSRSDSSLSTLNPPFQSTAGISRDGSLAKQIQADEHRRKTEVQLARLQEEEEQRFQFVRQMSSDTTYSDTPRHHYGSASPEKLRYDEGRAPRPNPIPPNPTVASPSDTAPEVLHQSIPTYSFQPQELPNGRRRAPRSPVPLETHESNSFGPSTNGPPDGIFSDLDDIISSLGSRDLKRKTVVSDGHKSALPVPRADAHELSTGPSTRRRTTSMIPPAAPKWDTTFGSHEVDATESQIPLAKQAVPSELPQEGIYYELATQKSFRRPESGEIQAKKMDSRAADWQGHTKGREMANVEIAPNDSTHRRHARYIAMQQSQGQWRG